MSYHLWKSLLENDVDSFRQHVARASHNGATRVASFSLHPGSPSSLGSSPKTPKTKRGGQVGSAGRNSGVHWTKAEINAKDRQGLTILHYAASSQNEKALEFVKILLSSPQLDLYVQDAENGWTALHRALYFGNVDIAQALLLKDVQNATDYAATALHAQAGGLIKIKDNEGNSPFEVFGSTIAPRTIQTTDPGTIDAGGEDESVNGIDVREEYTENRNARLVQPRVDLQGDEVYAFGSNKNLTLGLGDGDDRQHPERIHLRRPEHLLRRLYEDYIAESGLLASSGDLGNSLASLPTTLELPAIIQNKAIIIQEVIMSKFSTTILTSDPISNLHVTGFGPGGRLGTGDEATRFNFICIQGALAKRRVSTIALGQDHAIAICSSGEVFTWGNAQDGKLGYTVPETSPKEIPMQMVPRQLYGLVKKEQIVGAAASAIHSIIFTPTALFAFGRNAGQLGLVDADARSLEAQVIPRRVGTSILQSPIQSVAAIDRATTVLLENHEVIVFTHYAWKKIIFPFEEVPELYSNTALRTVYDKVPNSIVKVTNGGNTICAVSSFGQVFTIDVPKEADHVPSNVSTTNPNKARNALPPPSIVWSIGKPHMAAIDAAVGQDGSIILCTISGAVWQKEKRANMKSIHEKSAGISHIKDYKFVRVSNTTRAMAVRSNARGAFSVIRKDCEVTREQIIEDPPLLWENMFPLLAFKDYGTIEDENSAEPQLRFWTPKKSPSPSSIRQAVLSGKTVEDDFMDLSKRFEPLSDSGYDIWVTSNVTDVRTPVHSFLLKARSSVLRTALTSFEQSYYVDIPDVASIEYGQDGYIQIKFHGADFLTIVNLVLYLYSDNIVDVWHHTAKALKFAPRYRQVRVELMRVAASLDLGGLERAARVMVDPARSMMQDMEGAYLDSTFFANADVMIDLADEAEAPAHSALLCARCPFFEGLFHGHAGGMWMSSRRNEVDGIVEPTRVDLKHVDSRTFSMVLRYIYADTGEEMFDDVITNDLDEFLDTVVDVLSIANELMLDRLAQICQKVVGRYVTMRNVCGLLNAIAECSVTDFKIAALEYICLNLEGMLAQRLLEELDDYLLEELVEVIRENQLAFMPISRSGRAEAELIDRHPELVEELDRARQSRIDSMRLSTRYVDDERWTPKQRRPGPDEDARRKSRNDQNSTPSRSKNAADDDFQFAMDEDGTPHSPISRSVENSPSIHPVNGRKPSEHLLGTPTDPNVNLAPNSVDTDGSYMRTPVQAPVSSPPSGMGLSSFELPKAAWTTPVSNPSRTDLRSIMEQTSSSRVSSLSQAINAAAVGPIKSAPRMSQSQRKKQAQEMKKQDITVKEVETNSPSSQPQSQSPWTKTTAVPKRNISTPMINATPPPSTSHLPSRPAVDPRQRVTRAPSSTRDVSSAKTASAPAIRTVSNSTPAESSKPIVPQIQSVRHTPMDRRARSFLDARTSMAEILAQEQADKLAIKEAAAKRSLQEIQQEQEFEAWWSAETLRVQEEEAQAVAAASNQKDGHRKSGRGRGSRKRGSARGAAASVPVAATMPLEEGGEEHHPSDRAPPAATTPSQPITTNSSRGRDHGRGQRGRGIGAGRGRGRGKAQAT